MTYPTITMYLEAMDDAKRSLRTIKGVQVVRDEMGEPIYRTTRSSIVVRVTIAGEQCSMRLFLRESTKTYKGKLYRSEILVASSLGAEYYDVMVEPYVELSDDTPSKVVSAELYENLRAVQYNGHWGYEDLSGRLVIEALYDWVEDFSEGRAAVEKAGYYGLIDTKGNRVIELIYDELSYDGSHLCYVEQEGKCGVVDRRGKVVVEPAWDWVAEFSCGLLLVEIDGKYGYVDMNGKLAIKPIYQDASSFDANQYASVTLNGVSYQIDTDQNRV